MSDLDRSRNFELECLRLAANCLHMAAEVSDPVLQSHFLRMAKLWPILAERGIGAEIPAGIHFNSMQRKNTLATRH